MSWSKGNRFTPLQATANQKTMTSGLARKSSGSRKYYAGTKYSGAAPPASALPIPKFCQRPSILAKRDTVAGIYSETRTERLVGSGLKANTKNTISHNQDALYSISQQQSSGISKDSARNMVNSSLLNIDSDPQDRHRVKDRPKRYLKTTNSWTTCPHSRSLQPTPMQIQQVRDLIFEKIYGLPWGQVQAPFDRKHQRQALPTPTEWNFEDTSEQRFRQPLIIQNLVQRERLMIHALYQFQQIEDQLTLLRMKLNQNLMVQQQCSSSALLPVESINQNRTVQLYTRSTNCTDYDRHHYGDGWTLRWVTFERDTSQTKEQVWIWDEGYVSA